MGDSFKKYHEDIGEQGQDESPTSLHEQIDKLQKEVSRIYTEELFRARIRNSELEQKIRVLEENNMKLQEKILKLEQQEYVNNTDQENDDWYTSHGQGD